MCCSNREGPRLPCFCLWHCRLFIACVRVKEKERKREKGSERECDMTLACVTLLTHICHNTHLYVSRDTCITWHMHQCRITHSYVSCDFHYLLRDAFICVTRLVSMCDITPPCVTWFAHYLTCLIPICQMPHSHTSYASWQVHVNEACGMYECLMARISMRHVIHTNGGIRKRVVSGCRPTLRRVSCSFPTSFLHLSDEFLATRTQKSPRNDPEKAKWWDSLDQDAKLYPQNPSPATRALKPNNPSLKTEHPEP